MPRCFVIQPFDNGGPFDKRYDEVLAPAITAASLEPYRVDRDLSVTIPIDDIEKGIRESDVCLADISQDNPNVWFELGYAFACRKEVILICSADRVGKFPFDVQHRHIVKYKRESSSDFDALKSEITARLTAASLRSAQMESLAATPVLAAEDGLSPVEVVTLVVVMQSAIDYPPTARSIKNDVMKAGYTEIAGTLGIRQLERKGFIQSGAVDDFRGETYFGYTVTEPGETWLIKNQDRLVLEKPKKKEDDLPF